MKIMTTLRLATAVCVSVLCMQARDPKVVYKNGEFEAAFIGKIETESAADVNANYFNSHINDKLFATKTKIDLSMTTKTESVRSKITARSKVVWGNHKTISTDLAYLANLNADPTAHSHKIGPNMLWVREVWVQSDMTELCNLQNVPKQFFTIGSFSFQLGRGIALGDAYGVTPASMGFFQDNTVDQYAWGVKLSGGLIEKLISYDVYLSILDNKTTNLTETNAPTQVKAFGTSNTKKVRGAGKINFVSAAHMFITPLNSDTTKLSFEPYVMHNYDPEQKIEYFCDAKSILTTPGLAVEFSTGRFEFGFDSAFNVGHQYVKGWDRNSIKVVNTGGYATYVYTDVYTVNPAVVTPTQADQVLYDPSNSSQNKAIASVTPGAVSNGAPIAGTNLYNSLTRYRTPYKTKFHGFMWVGDASFWLVPKNLVVSATWGITSGDQNPNTDLNDPNDTSVDLNYNGFIPFQEMYSGKRVQSFYCMTSILTRPLDVSNLENAYASVTNNFSNLIFWGFGCKYAPEYAKKKWNINPNFLMYWQDVASNKFDIAMGKSTTEKANKYLGMEVNLFFMASLSDDMYVSGGAGLYVPGTYYFDIKGKPTSSSARSALDSAIKAGTSTKALQLVSNNSSYNMSMAMGYMF